MDLTAILQLLPALASTNIALLAEAWAAIVRAGEVDAALADWADFAAAMRLQLGV